MGSHSAAILVASRMVDMCNSIVKGMIKTERTNNESERQENEARTCRASRGESELRRPGIPMPSLNVSDAKLDAESKDQVR